MTSEQATFLLNEICLPQLANESKTTKRVIEAVPADQGAYKPSERCMSAWELATHIAGADMMFLNGVANGAFSRDESVPESVKTPAQLAAWYEENIAAATAKLKKLSGADLTRNIEFAGGIFNFPAVAYLQLMMSHSIHHRGQLSSYLRPMGAKVPSIYGPSADQPIQAPAKA